MCRLGWVLGLGLTMLPLFPAAAQPSGGTTQPPAGSAQPPPSAPATPNGQTAPSAARLSSEQTQPERPPPDDEALKQRIAVNAETISSLEAAIPKLWKQWNKHREEDLNDTERAWTAAVREEVEARKRYDVVLKELADLRAALRVLEDEQATVTFSEELALIQKTINDLRQDTQRWRESVSEDELKLAQQELETAKSELQTRLKNQEAREKRRADHAARKEEAARAVVETQARLLDVVGDTEGRITSPTTGDVERATAEFRLAKARIDTSIALHQGERLDLEARRDARQASQAEQRTPLLSDLVAQHERRVERLRQLRTRSELDRVRERAQEVAANPDRFTPLERAYWELREAMLSGQQELAEMQRKAGIGKRFSEIELVNLKADLSAELGTWGPLFESIDRRSGEKIQAYYRRVGELVVRREAQRDRLRSLYDTTLDDRARIIDRLDRIDDDIDMRILAFSELAAAETNNELVVRFRAQRDESVKGFEKDLADIRENLRLLAERLREGAALLTGHVDTLAAYRSRLYWSYLRVQDQPIWKYSPSKSTEEWRAEVSKRRGDLERVRESFERLSLGGAIAIAAILLAAIFLSLWLRARLLRYADGYEARIGERMQEQQEATIAPLSDRLHLQAIRFLGRTSLVLWPGIVAGVCVTVSPMDGRITRAAVIVLTAAGVFSALISTLFSRSKPRFRLVPCSNVVAGHYRRWLRVLLWTSLILVPVPLFLSMFDWALYSRNYLWGAYKIAALVILLLFGINRQTVLRVVGRPEQVKHRLLYVMVQAAYPLMYLAVLLLLVLQVVGFGPLITYVIAGVTRTLLTLVVTILAVRYFRDLAGRYKDRLATLGQGTPDRDGTAESERGAALTAGREVTLLEPGDRMDADLWIGMVGSLLRWAAWLSAAVMILGYWGVSAVDLKQWLHLEILAAAEDRPAVTIGRALMAVVVLVLSWLASRGLRSFLESRVYPNYGTLDRGGRVAISTLLHYTIVFFGLYFSLYTLRIPLGALTVVLGTLGLGLGLGLQPVFVNFISGLIILFERHLKVGDMVEVNSILGEVTRISLRATCVKTFDNIDLVIPNSEFVSSRVVNWTLNDPRIRGKIEIGVSYDSDPRLVERLLLQVATEWKSTLRDPPPSVRFVNFGDNSLDFIVFAWFNNTAERWDFMTHAKYRILELFRENGVEIPFPQRTLSTLGGQPIRVQVEAAASTDGAPPRVRPQRREDPESANA